MSDADLFEQAEPQPSPGDFARGRIEGRLSASRSFTLDRRNSEDFGEPGRFVSQVFDDDGTGAEVVREGDQWTLTNVGGRRTLVKALVAREPGNIVDLWLQVVPARGNPRTVLHLHRSDARRFLDALRRIELIDPGGADASAHIDDHVVANVLNNPESAAALYGNHAEKVRLLIASDDDARDVVALAGRRRALEEFRLLLDDDAHFDAASADAGGPEHVWQKYFQANPWTLGIGLGSQLLTSWSDDRLEQVVAGYSVHGAGKRADAFLRTAGVIRSLVFAEFKHHRTELLKSTEYRPAIWRPSNELVGGLAQVQGTVQRALSSLGDRLQKRDSEGFETAGEVSYLLRPRSFLIIGRLEEFTNDRGEHHPDKVKSFELFRRHLHEPEVVTFDELLARAEWIVDSGSS
jgi:hypothetical protein